MSPWMYRFTFILGIFALLHSAFSAAQHRSFQRINRQVREAGNVDAASLEPQLPLDIWLETLLSAGVVLFCFVHMMVKLKDIRPQADFENRTMESLDFRPSFMVFGQKESLYKLRLLDQKSPISVEELDNKENIETDDVPPLENE